MQPIAYTPPRKVFLALFLLAFAVTAFTAYEAATTGGLIGRILCGLVAAGMAPFAGAWGRRFVRGPWGQIVWPAAVTTPE